MPDPSNANAPLGMTVGELCAALSVYDDDTLIVLEVDLCEWRGLNRVNGPLDDPEDDVQRAVSLVPGGPRL